MICVISRIYAIHAIFAKSERAKIPDERAKIPDERAKKKIIIFYIVSTDCKLFIMVLNCPKCLNGNPSAATSQVLTSGSLEKVRHREKESFECIQKASRYKCLCYQGTTLRKDHPDFSIRKPFLNTFKEWLFAENTWNSFRT